MEKKANIVVKLNGIEIKSTIDGKDFLDKKTLNDIKESLNRDLKEKIKELESERDAYDNDYINSSFVFDPAKVLEGDKMHIYYVLYRISNGRITVFEEDGNMFRSYRKFKASEAKHYVVEDCLRYIWTSSRIREIQNEMIRGSYSNFGGGRPYLTYDPTSIGIKPFVTSFDLFEECIDSIAGYVLKYGVESLLYISKSELFDPISRDIFQIFIARSIYNKVPDPSKYISPKQYAELLLHADYSEIDNMINFDFEELKETPESIKNNEYLICLISMANKSYGWNPDKLIRECLEMLLRRYPINSNDTHFIKLLNLIDIVNTNNICNSVYYVGETYISGDTIRKAYQNMYIDFKLWYSDAIYKILPENADVFFDYLMQFNTDIAYEFLYNSNIGIEKKRKPKYAQYYRDKLEEKHEYCKKTGVSYSE